MKASLQLVSVALAMAAGTGAAADWPQFGQWGSRNMVSPEKGLPDGFDPKSGTNVKWAADLGTVCYVTPVVAGGRVFIGTNNRVPRDPRITDDRGILLALDEATGKFLWQLAVPKLKSPIASDTGQHGFFATPTIEGDRLYVVTNRCEVVCLDTAGMANGNDGLFKDEARYLADAWPGPFRLNLKPIEPGPGDADIVWRYDMIAGLGVRPQDGSNGSPLVVGDYVYVCTSNGTDVSQEKVANPQAPSLIVLDKKTGALVAKDDFGIGGGIVHGQWSSPATGQVDGKPLIVFGAGNGVCYGFRPVEPAANGKVPPAVEALWSFDCDRQRRAAGPASPWHRQDTRGTTGIVGCPVLVDGRVYVAAGGDPWHGIREAQLNCLTASGRGDTTKSAEAWSYEIGAAGISTPAIADGLAYITDCAGRVHCVDAATGKVCWTHQERGEIWASPLVADGKVYTGTRKGVFLVFAAGREKKVLNRIELADSISATPVAANGVLYVATSKMLYALRQGGR